MPMSRPNGVVAPGTSLVTGYDFLEDAANAVRTELELGTGGVSDALITPNGKSPQDPLRGPRRSCSSKLLGARHDVIFLAGHFSANSALAADFSTNLLTTDLAASPVDLTNSIVFSAGCHSGYNLVDADAIAGVTMPLDWAQAFARKRATLGRRHRLSVRRHRLPRIQRAALQEFRAAVARGYRAPSRSVRRWSRRSSTISRRRPTSAASTRRRCWKPRCSGCRCSA